MIVSCVREWRACFAVVLCTLRLALAACVCTCLAVDVYARHRKRLRASGGLCLLSVRSDVERDRRRAAEGGHKVR